MAQAQSSPRRPGSMMGMLISLAIVVVVVLVIFALNNKPANENPKAVDYGMSLEVAQTAGVIDAQVPRPVPEGWVATSANYDLISSHPTKIAQWTVGFVTPNNEFVGVRQGNGESEKFIQQMTVNGEAKGQQDVNGQKWTRYTSPETDNESLVLIGPKQTTVVTGTVGWEELGRVAGSLGS